MRIISGKYKNRELKSPNSSITHPMGERERLAIFNMLISELGTPDLGGKTALDLFAGTGALGLEALSRGATSCTFVEKDPKTLACLKQNLKNIENCKVIKDDVYKIKLEDRFDLVFVDQPYDKFNKDIKYFDKFLNNEGKMIVSSPMPLNAESRSYAGCWITILEASKARQ